MFLFLYIISLVTQLFVTFANFIGISTEITGNVENDPNLFKAV